MKQINSDVSDAVRLYAFQHRQTISEFARQFGMKRSTLQAKLTGRNNWSLEEADALARLGVEVPPLGGVEC